MNKKIKCTKCGNFYDEVEIGINGWCEDCLFEYSDNFREWQESQEEDELKD